MPQLLQAQALRRTPNEILEQWEIQLRTLHAGHWEAARKSEGRNVALGLATALMSAIAGTAAFASLQGGTDPWTRIAAGVFGVAAAMVSSAQTYYKSSERAERHRSAAGKYGRLRREFQQFLALGLPTDQQRRERILSAFRKQWDDVDAESPAIPSKTYERVKHDVAARRQTPAVHDAA